jgi:hypothetical protein
MGTDGASSASESGDIFLMCAVRLSESFPVSWKSRGKNLMRAIRRNLHRTASKLCYGIACLLAVGCASLTPPPASQATIPTPTVASFFQNTTTQASIASSAAPTQTVYTPAIGSSPTPRAAVSTRTADQIAAIALFDDALNADWSAKRSNKVKYDLASKAVVHGGKKAILVTPTDDFGQFFLTVSKDARKIYPRDRILGISFWLNGGANSIATSDLAVTVTGSNQYAYWLEDDTSVKVDTPVTPDAPLFPETRLYYLHINHSIPPNTWVEVILWLDDLIYDPNYTNITGMYIKNDKGFLNPYYIDDVQLLVQRPS